VSKPGDAPLVLRSPLGKSAAVRTNQALLIGGGFSAEEQFGSLNSRAIHAAEIPAGNGIGNARSLAKMYAATIGEIDGSAPSQPSKEAGSVGQRPLAGQDVRCRMSLSRESSGHCSAVAVIVVKAQRLSKCRRAYVEV